MMDPVLSLPLPRTPEQHHKQSEVRWQQHMEQHQDSVENLLASNFNNLCADLRENISGGPTSYTRLRSDSFSSGLSSSSSTTTAITDLYSGSAPRSPAHIPHTVQKAAFSHGTLPRGPARRVLQQSGSSCSSCCTGQDTQPAPCASFQLSSPPVKEGVSWARREEAASSPLSPTRRLSFSSHHLPQGMAEVESMYTRMKDLNSPLPHAQHLLGGRMPALHHFHRSTDSLASVAASTMGEIPPPPPPVQSHAVLESGLGHTLPPSSIPRTPGVTRRVEGTWPKPPNLPLPPLPPKRTSSRLSDMIRPNNLNLSQDSQDSIYARPKPFLHRSSLMSTGSSDSGASSGPSDADLPLSPISPASELMFTWPHYSLGPSQSSPTEHRSVSQAGDQETSSEAHNTSIARSDVYVKMNPVSPVFSQHVEGSPYMNLLYDAVQRQGGTGSVETAMSPYLEMTAAMSRTNVRNLRHAAIDTVSAIYAQIESSAVSQVSDTGARPPGLPRGRRPSTGGGKAVLEFRQLMQEVEKKRHFRVGLNLFNTNPDIGIDYLVKQSFLELVPLSIAKFLYSTPSLAKEKVGEYLGHIQSAFCMKVLSVFMEEFNFSGLRIDKALRQLLTYVKVPGEAAKIEKIMEVFGKRYNKCNPNFASKLRSNDSVLTLAFAIMLLNTDLHNASVKTDKKMLEKEFMSNLKSADDGKDFDSKLLKQVYKGVKKEAFSSGIDHVAQTNLLQAKISGKAPSLAASHRRLVCLIRLAEVMDIQTKNKSEATNHERNIWLFNDTMVLTKVIGQEKGNPVYNYRDSFPLKGMEVTLFHTPVFQFGIQVSRKTDSAVLATLNAESEQDRYKFVMDLQESIFEMDLMERALRDANMIK